MQAGGRSKRMGRDKSTIRIGNMDLIERVYTLVEEDEDLERVHELL